MCTVNSGTRRKSRRGSRTLEGRCSPYYQNSPLYPILSLFQEHVVRVYKHRHCTERDLKNLKICCSDYSVSTVGQETAAQAHIAETLSLLAELLEIPFESPAANGNRYRHSFLLCKTDRAGHISIRMEAQAATATDFRSACPSTAEDVRTETDTLHVVEDLHWIDPSSIEFLTLLIARIEKATHFHNLVPPIRHTPLSRIQKSAQHPLQ